MTAWRRRDGLAMLVPIACGVLALTAADARAARHGAQRPPLTIAQGGCGFRPAVEAIVQRVQAKVPDGEPYKAREAARFAFGPLHGVGVVAEANDDFSGEEIYFREDRAALRRALTGIGLHLDREGTVAEAARFVDGGHGMVSVSIHAIEARAPDPHFPAARSFLSCGAL